jgi:putative transcription antitermination factor YqgF
LYNSLVNYLGLDYGTSQIGIAISGGPLVEPLSTVKTEKALGTITQICDLHKIDHVIIGLPEGPVRPMVEKFILALRRLNLSVISQDETLSSHDALASLSHTTPARRKLREHSVAAALILKSWLDSHPQPL